MNHHFLTLNQEIAIYISKIDSTCFSSPDIAIHGVWEKQIHQARDLSSSNHEMTKISSNFENQTFQRPVAVHSGVWIF
jgi:hypothetical protein